MKRILGILLAACMMLTFAGCKEENDTKKIEGVDLEYYSKYGQIPECEYALGQDVDELLSVFEASVESESTEDEEEEEGHDHSEFFYTVLPNETYTSIHTGEIEYLYKEESRDKGISCIISYTDAYEFALGTVSVEVDEAFSEFEVSRYDASAGEIFFMPGGEFSCLEYSFEKNNIIFVFADNALCATAIYNNSEWDIN